MLTLPVAPTAWNAVFLHLEISLFCCVAQGRAHSPFKPPVTATFAVTPPESTVLVNIYLGRNVITEIEILSITGVIDTKENRGLSSRSESSSPQ